MPRSLVSYWKRVATSGPTTDGRDILPQELRDIAETYKPSLYTAVIWSEHDRSQGSYGTVFAVRLLEEGEDLEPGQVALEAQLKPNDRLLELNDQGQKLFSSIEIYPNFRGKGKSYMTGLAVTDEPASIGTQELYFSRKTSERTYYAASVELVHAHHDSANSDEKGLIKAIVVGKHNHRPVGQLGVKQLFAGRVKVVAVDQGKQRHSYIRLNLPITTPQMTSSMSPRISMAG